MSVSSTIAVAVILQALSLVFCAAFADAASRSAIYRVAVASASLTFATLAIAAAFVAGFSLRA